MESNVITYKAAKTEIEDFISRTSDKPFLAHWPDLELIEIVGFADSGKFSYSIDNVYIQPEDGIRLQHEYELDLVNMGE